MIIIGIWSASGKEKPNSSYLEIARDLRMPKIKAYRMKDGGLIIYFPSYGDEQVGLFEDFLQKERFGKVPIGQAGSLKNAHYAKFDSSSVH